MYIYVVIYIYGHRALGSSVRKAYSCYVRSRVQIALGCLVRTGRVVVCTDVQSGARTCSRAQLLLRVQSG